jgi:hypothetical protein
MMNLCVKVFFEKWWWWRWWKIIKQGKYIANWDFSNEIQFFGYGNDDDTRPFFFLLPPTPPHSSLSFSFLEDKLNSCKDWSDSKFRDST